MLKKLSTRTDILNFYTINMEGQEETLIWILIAVIVLMTVIIFLLGVIYLDTQVRMEYWRNKCLEAEEEEPYLENIVCEHNYKHEHTNWYKCTECGYVTAIGNPDLPEDVVFQATTAGGNSAVVKKKDLSDDQTGLIYPQN